MNGSLLRGRLQVRILPGSPFLVFARGKIEYWLALGCVKSSYHKCEQNLFNHLV
ncbi:hypothetical protein SAMN04488515_3245 [Cognatiyoonia koreensis]|uniref:Uncharacterized protein n=1 Tax=Cognatiyoonia koreensis TaxID=364200 RepID=A0A1I0RU02_9RHOB|nr:hypothetical protein SAMN04488515_3245 [Cognatiyoonia koreensis]